MTAMIDRYDIGSISTGFDVSHGFLPRTPPINQLPKRAQPWLELAQSLPAWMASNQLKRLIEDLPPLVLEDLTSSAEIHCAMRVVSYLGHAYVWEDHRDTPMALPSVLAMAWYGLSVKVGRPPMLSYASYALDNWRLLDQTKPLALDNVALLQHFLGGIDEVWFILIHVVIEHQATTILQAILKGMQAIDNHDESGLLLSLQQLLGGITMIVNTLQRMPEHCDPYVYYHRVRPYIHGWNNHPALPQGLIYTGVKAYQGKPQTFKGETGAQSTVIPTVDAFLSITQSNDPLKTHLVDMLSYAPPSHQAWVSWVRASGGVRQVIIEQFSDSALISAYNACVQQVDQFRSIHFQFAIDYIQSQSQHDKANPNDVGTGGTPFVKYLRKHQQSCASFLIDR